MIEHFEWIEKLAGLIRDAYQSTRYRIALKFGDAESAGYWAEEKAGDYQGQFHQKRGKKWDY